MQVIDEMQEVLGEEMNEKVQEIEMLEMYLLSSILLIKDF